MGSGLALIFATKKYDVALYGRREESLAQAVGRIRANLELMAQNGIGDESEIEPALKRVKSTMDMKEAVSGAGFVFECVAENMELKQNIFCELDSLCPEETVLATNTSVMSITEIAQKARHQERIVGTHFWNPPFLIPLVEVVKAKNTSPEIMDKAFDFLKLVGKHPVRVHKDVPGFVANRLQHALWREAISIVERGIADAATVDECIRFGFGIRLPVLGPMENADMVGTDLTLAIHDYILKHLENSPEPSPLLREMVAKGNLGFKTGEGFQKWSPEEAERSRTRLIKYLLKNLAAN
ncbi:MAG: 3-hydroxyacyl-CoA dehydrogenase family protein [Peptococcaceae bacterium]|nr:3-hydroxyacyl-CoA dehydrogenase family protein [Peptococcaceae bacterium]